MATPAAPLVSYCANVHPAATWDELFRTLDEVTLPALEAAGPPFGVGLWLPHRLVDDPARGARLKRLRGWLDTHGVLCESMNAFPYGNFHGRTVKRSVYQPDWASGAVERQRYTLQVAECLAALLPEETKGTISTLPLGYQAAWTPDQQQVAVEWVRSTAYALVGVQHRTGRHVQLAVEPEPFCAVATADSVRAFGEAVNWHPLEPGVYFQEDDPHRKHLGLCYDVCHQAAQFETPAQFLAAADAGGLRVVKVQVSSALELADPADPDARAALARFAEPRYLHQTFARTHDGRVLALEDLTSEFCHDPPREWLEAEAWRVHFHVPIHLDELGPLRTTRADIAAALPLVRRLTPVPTVEVETYTWGVLGAAAPPGTLAEGLTAELVELRRQLVAADAADA